MQKQSTFLLYFFIAFVFLGACKTNQATSASAKSSTSASAKSLLWKIEGNGITTPSYLFGTIHMISQDDFFMTPATKDALANSQQIVLELDMDDPGMQMEMMQYVMMKDGQTLDKLVSEEEYKKIDDAMKDAMGMGVEMFKSMTPMIVSSMLMPGYVDGELASYEGELVKLAKSANKEVVGLETVKEQMDAMNGSMTYEEQAKQLVEMVVDVEKGKAQYHQLVGAYKAQDIDGLHDFIIEQSGGTEISEKLIYQRNENWITRIGAIAKETPSFFGVGSGHLGGERGVINLLRQAGYTVTPIM